MRLIPTLTLLFSTLAMAACDRSPPAASTADPVAAHPVQRSEWILPITTAAAQPDLVRAPDGALLLSWMEVQGDGHALKFARYADGAWGEVQPIARGEDWFVNWADTPHLAVTADGALWAHWLQKSAQAKYAYDVAMVRSGDGGVTWSRPVLVNDDGTPTEHGFVSMWPAARDRIGIAWLDGRRTGGGEEVHGDHEGHGAAGAMTLRAATFDAALRRGDERELDTMTCDCCQTDATLTTRGPLLVYRDRTPDEIRDIAVTRFDGAAWTTPRLVHADQWKMPACPVNGPAVAAMASNTVVGWYTVAADQPTLRLARSADAGETFAAPLMLDQGAHVQGRVDVALDSDEAWVLWTREEGGVQSLQFARFASDLSREWQRGEVARLRGRGRATGVAQLVLGNDGAYVVWTDVVDGKPRLAGARYGAAP